MTSQWWKINNDMSRYYSYKVKQEVQIDGYKSRMKSQEGWVKSEEFRQISHGGCVTSELKLWWTYRAHFEPDGAVYMMLAW